MSSVFIVFNLFLSLILKLYNKIKINNSKFELLLNYLFFNNNLKFELLLKLIQIMPNHRSLNNLSIDQSTLSYL